MEVMKKSVEELLLLRDFIKLAEEADKAEKLIKKNFSDSFGPDKKTILVHSEEIADFCAKGFLTSDGVFLYEDNWGYGNSHEFRADSDGIYKMLRSCYLKRHDLRYLDTESSFYRLDNLEDFFRNFISKLEKSNKGA